MDHLLALVVHAFVLGLFTHVMLISTTTTRIITSRPAHHHVHIWIEVFLTGHVVVLFIHLIHSVLIVLVVHSVFIVLVYPFLDALLVESAEVVGKLDHAATCIITVVHYV